MKSRTPAALRILVPHAIAAACALAGHVPVLAAEIDTGHPDWKVRWDNTLRYNLGMRVEKQDSRILNGVSYDESDAKFHKGQVVTNRLDLLSEVDISFRSDWGARVSAAGWYDAAYDDRSVRSPAAGGAVPSSYRGNTFNNTVSRYVNGPSAEFLDAFAWTNFNLGAVPVNVKLGRHTIVWGEGLLLGGHAISYSQAPTDGVKAVASPGIETKEVFLPLNQLSFKAQLTSDLTLAGQYFLEWAPTRVPNGGTYLMGADTSPNVDLLGLGAGVAARREAPLVPRQRGNWGLSARLNVEAIESTLGAYYREFNDYTPETGIQFTSFVPGAPLPATFRFDYPKDVKLVGLSLAKPLGPVSFGAELSLRQNAHLNSKTTYLPSQNTGARGDTLHAVINGIYLLPKTALWDTGSLTAELAYSRLQKVTANPDLYRGEGYASCVKVNSTAPASGDKTDACSTKDFLQMAVNLTPQYLGVFPSWDLDLPISLNYGIKGVAPTGGGGFEKVLSWSLGAKLTYQSKHEFSLRISDLSAPAKYNAAGTALAGGGALGSSVGATDRRWVVATFKTSF